LQVLNNLRVIDITPPANQNPVRSGKAEGSRMRTFIDALRKVGFPLERTHSFRTASGVVVLSMIGMAAPCQTPTPAPSPSAPPAPAQTTQAPATEPNAAASALATHADASPVPAKNPVLSQGAFTVQTVGGEIKEDQLKQLLVGKTLYLRAGYQDNNLEFDEQGRLQSHSSKASFTLSQIQINKVKVSKRKIEFEGDRYALHFLGAAPRKRNPCASPSSAKRSRSQRKKTRAKTRNINIRRSPRTR
jgi:hypothetical protein